MKKKIISILVLIFAVCMCLGLAACANESMDEVKKKEGYNVTVTLDALEGKFEDTQGSVRTVLVKPNSKLPNPGYKDNLQNGIPECTLYKNKVIGWYYGTKNEETGEVTYGEEFEFMKDVIIEDITLYAKWQRLSGYCIIVNGQETDFIDVDETKLQSFSQFSPAAPKWEGHTFMGYVTEDSKPFDMDAPYPSDGTNEVYVYTSFIEGDYKLVSTAKEFIDGMNATNVSANFYLLNDINLEGQTWFGPEIFSGIIKGNGYAIRNLTYNFESENSRISNIGLFGQLGIDSRAAEITGVTFENVILNVSLKTNLRSSCNLGLLCGTVTNLKMENVELKNCSITFSEGSLEKLNKGGPSIEEPYYYGFLAGTDNLTLNNVKGNIAHPEEWDITSSSEEIQ